MSSTNEQLARMSPEEQRALLAQKLAAKALRPKVAPLSFAQERQWLFAQIYPDNPEANMLFPVRLHGTLDVAVLERTLNEIVQRHASLRTTFVIQDGRPVQVIAPLAAIKLQTEELALTNHGDAATVLERARQRARAEAQQPFDLAQGPLFRAKLLRLAADDHILLLSIHHIISDTWSQGVLARELAALYEAFIAGRSSPLSPLPLQYADFAQWQRQVTGTNALQVHLDYWKRQLAPPLPLCELLTDHAHTDQSPHLLRRTLLLPNALQEKLEELGRQRGATLFMILLAALQVLLYRYTGQTDILVGTPVVGRDRAELEGIIGPFINSLVLRTDLSGDPPFVELLGRVRQTMLEALAHQDVPFAQLVAELQPERTLNRNPLFQVVLNLLGPAPLDLELPGLKLGRAFDDLGLEGEVPDMLGIPILETPEGLLAILECRSDLLLQDRILGHFQTLLESIVAHPAQPLASLPILTKSERQQLVVEWNDTHKDYADEACLHTLIEAQVERTPEVPAIIFENQVLSYRELDCRANQLAQHLQKLDIRPESIVGVCMERSIEMVVALLGVLKAGGAYMPLDPTLPQERLAFMLKDAHSQVVLTQQRWVDKLDGSSVRVICLDNECKTMTRERKARPLNRVEPDNPAYVIYTSGSTGQPKGAVNTHRGIVNRLLWMQDAYQLDSSDCVLQKTPYTFDVSVWEFFWPLLTGARLVIARPEGHKDPTYLADLVVKQGITTLHFVPSMLRAFLENAHIGACTSLRRVICSGEALPYELQERFFEKLNADLYNLYGPTEASVDVTHWTCERHSKRRGVPIGQPIANTQIYLLDQQLQAVPVGVPGELYIGGVGLGRGYLNRPDLTAERFIPNPFVTTKDYGAPIRLAPFAGRIGASRRMTEEPPSPDVRPSSSVLRLYRTGDLAYYLPDGSIEYLGRMDFQVKVRGFRIELGEIEARLSEHPAVQQAVVVAREAVSTGQSTAGLSGDKRLVAYVVFNTGQEVSVTELRDFLQARLPEHMIPSAFIKLAEIPLTVTGKVNRKALPAPDASAQARTHAYVPPEGSLEERLAAIWAQVLGVEKIGRNDNFFDLGGHSLLVTEVIYRTNQLLQLNLSVRNLLENPTIALLALLIGEILIEELEKEEL